MAATDDRDFTLRIRGGFMADVRDYFRLARRWYEDPVLTACADIEPACLWAWPIIVAKGKDALHATSNPSGEFGWTIRQMDQTVRIGDEKRTRRAVELLEEGELVSVLFGPLGSLKMTVSKLGKWQVAPGSVAERMQRKRDTASREKASPRYGHVTPALPPRYTDRDRDRDITPHPPVERPPAPARARQAAVARADDEVAAVAAMTTTLSRVADEGTSAAAAEALMFRSSKRHPSAGTILPLAQWVAAVDAFVAKVESGWSPPEGDLVGYIIGMVPTAGAALTIDPSKVVTPESKAEREAAERLRKLDELYSAGAGVDA